MSIRCHWVPVMRPASEAHHTLARRARPGWRPRGGHHVHHGPIAGHHFGWAKIGLLLVCVGGPPVALVPWHGSGLPPVPVLETCCLPSMAGPELAGGALTPLAGGADVPFSVGPETAVDIGEPGALAVFGVGLVGLLAMRRR